MMSFIISIFQILLFMLKFIIPHYKYSFNSHMKHLDQHQETPRKSTLKKDLFKYQIHQEYKNHQYLNMIAKIRLLEDDFMTQKYKNEALENNILQYSKTIENMEYIIADQKQQLRQANEHINSNFIKNRQIQNYQLNIREVTHEITTLNQILMKKKSNENILLSENENLKVKVQQLCENLNIFRSNEEVYKKQLEQILQILNISHETSFSSTRNILNDMNSILLGIQQLKEKALKTKQMLQKARKQHSEELMKQKQNSIKLQYKIKLLEERNTDKQKHNVFENTLISDHKLEQIVEEMIKKEDELTNIIEDLKIENEELKDKYDIDLQSSTYHYKLQVSQLQKQLKCARQKCKESSEQKEILQHKYMKMVQNLEVISNSSIVQEQQVSRKYRQVIDENRLLQLKNSELQSQNKMLHKQLQLKENSHL